MSDDKIIDEALHDRENVDGIAIVIQEQTWRSGGKSFDVWEVDIDGEWGECLTEAESFDMMPTDDEIRTVLPEKGTHHFIVRVKGCTELQAGRVMIERIGPDEDFGFDYTIEHEGPFEDVQRNANLGPSFLHAGGGALHDD